MWPGSWSGCDKPLFLLVILVVVWHMEAELLNLCTGLCDPQPTNGRCRLFRWPVGANEAKAAKAAFSAQGSECSEQSEAQRFVSIFWNPIGMAPISTPANDSINMKIPNKTSTVTGLGCLWLACYAVIRLQIKDVFIYFPKVCGLVATKETQRTLKFGFFNLILWFWTVTHTFSPSL